jgi:hypothetical protein
MNPKLVGNWFLVRNNSGDNHQLMVVKANSVEPSIHEGAFSAIGMKSGWMSLDNEDDRFWSNEFSSITPADFNALKLPRVTYENSPLEIEIMPSGKVYFY